MKRLAAIVLGLVLGYAAAGWWGPSAVSAAPASGPIAAADKGDGKGHHDPSHDAAKRLVPGDEQITWYRPVVTGIGALFLAAVVIGVPALKIRGPEPEESHDDHGDDHH
ncbi:MAG: hypothetical protein R3336_03290 [Phycisphaeraceae bacterium]|nr:hypothetical protein [Phycisphaeraceae bacterium]